MLSSLIYFIFTLLVLIVVHELGHFLVARWCGVKVLRFSFGFGKVLYKWKDKLGTEFTWSLLPFGGYVSFLDENEAPVAPADLKFAFNRQVRWKRIAVIIAGPLFNFVLAFVLLWLVAVIGIESFAPRIEFVKSGSVADFAHLAGQEEIIAIDGKKINNWRDVHYLLLPLMGSARELPITVKNIKNGTISTHVLSLARWTFDAKRSDLLESLGIQPLFPKFPVLVGLISPASPAALAGFELEDEIIGVDHHPIKDWRTLADYVKSRPDAMISVQIRRRGILLGIAVHLGTSGQDKIGFLGLGSLPPEIPADWLRLDRYGPLDAIGQAWQRTLGFTFGTFSTIGRTLVGAVSLNNLSGPVGIAKAANESVQMGTVYYLMFVALLSISIGVLNLLPIPLLDGGHLLYEAIEMLISRPLSKKWKLRGLLLGVAVIMLLTLIALYNDLT